MAWRGMVFRFGLVCLLFMRIWDDDVGVGVPLRAILC
jgi:hypothetical protein